MSKYLDRRTDHGEPPAYRRSGIDCAEAHDLIPALALEVIETGERHVLRLHCQSCPACTDTLHASERVATLLAFAGTGHAPPERAKHALFERIAGAQASASVPLPAMTTALTIDAPVIDSPASKRRSPIDAPSLQAPTDGSGAPAWHRFALSGRMSKLAAGPLALALVLVTLYALQNFDTEPDDAPSSNPQVEEVAQVLSDSSNADQAPADSAATSREAEKPVSPSIGDVTFVDVDTAEFSASTEPVFQTFSASAGAAFTYRALSSGGGQTELLRAVSPNRATCSIVATIGSSAYAVTLSNVNLPGNTRIAGVYLVTADGEQLYVGSVVIDLQGNGSTVFSVDRPLDDFRTLQIGPLADAPGSLVSAPYFSAASFTLSWNDAERGLAPAS